MTALRLALFMMLVAGAEYAAIDAVITAVVGDERASATVLR